LLSHTFDSSLAPAMRDRVSMLAHSSLLCLGTHTLTGMLSTCGQQFSDWSASYRLFERERIDPQRIFDTALQTAAACTEADAPLVAALDDTILHKRGREVHGAAWRRDPLGPPFQTNFVWGQRFIQGSLMLPDRGNLRQPGPARGIPIAFHHAPTAHKPRKHADQAQWDLWRAEKKRTSLSAQGREHIVALRDRIDADATMVHRPLIVCVDGSYTNRTVCAALPPRTTLIGRIRKDARLYALPEEITQGPSQGPSQRRGRRPSYGPQLPTPDQLRQDPGIPWRTVRAWAAGDTFDFDVKSIGPVRWRAAGAAQNLRLLIVRPLAYRKRKGAHLLYRAPAYLICTDPKLTDAHILQAYLWRWEIELNFRDEKSLLGVGEAQVRTPAAVAAVPRFQVGIYSLLLVAERLLRQPLERLPRPLWQRTTQTRSGRASTQELLRMFRAETWARALDLENFSGFASNAPSARKPEKFKNSIASAICYAS
jgi:hypothetical protein